MICQNTSKHIDHEYTSEAVCPYCGYEDTDSWELDDEDLVECGYCQKEFYSIRIVDTTYSTEKARYGECKGCHKKDVVIEDFSSSYRSYKDLCESCRIAATRL